jgi:high-affinity iron transporter
MARNLFSIPIFFIIFRETLEAAIVVSVLLGLAKQIILDDRSNVSSTLGTEAESTEEKDKTTPSPQTQEPVDDGPEQRRRLLRKLRIQVSISLRLCTLSPTSREQIYLGAGLGLIISIAIGGAIVAVWVTKASNLWERAEALWEGGVSDHSAPCPSKDR